MDPKREKISKKNEKMFDESKMEISFRKMVYRHVIDRICLGLLKI